jgi:hypothetical protein
MQEKKKEEKNNRTVQEIYGVKKTKKGKEKNRDAKDLETE